MLTFLFWNLSQKPLAERLTRLVHLHEADVVILAECNIAAPLMLNSLNRNEAEFHTTYSECERLAIYARFPADYLEPRLEANAWTIRHLQLPNRPDVLLAAAHLPSNLRWKTSSLSHECIGLAEDIRRVERETGCKRALLVGDLNLNPFDSGVVSAKGLHSVMARAVAARKTRTVQRKPYRFFYNPMWNRMGDDSAGTPGTYFYQRAEHEVFFWNTFDQVMLRPELLPYFRTEELEILRDDGVASLLSTKHIPDARRASDHLPLLFKLHL